MSYHPRCVCGVLCALLAVTVLSIGSQAATSATQTRRVNLNFIRDTTFRDTGSNYTAWDTASLTVTACNLRYAGYWFSWDTHWILKNGGKITVDSAARLNNNEVGLIYARTFEVVGSGTGTNVIEFDAGFKADHMNYDPANLSKWTNCGLSLITFDGCDVITNSSTNLTTVYKKCWNDSLSHHGLWLFGKEGGAVTGSRWTIKTNDQDYDGGIAWMNPLTITTDKNLTIKGINGRCASVNFGSMGKKPAILSKKGAGALIINGTQAYNKGSRFDIQQGSVVFGTDPGDSTTYPYHYLTSEVGQYLTLNVTSGASVQFLSGAVPYDIETNTYFPVVRRNGVDSLISHGTVRVGAGIVDVAGKLSLQSGATLRFGKVAQGTTIQVKGAATCAGTLVVDTLPSQIGDYPLISAASVTGTLSTSIPTAVAELVYESNKVILRVKTTSVRSPVERSRSGLALRIRPASQGGTQYCIDLPTKSVTGAIRAELITPTGTVVAGIHQINRGPERTEVILESRRELSSHGPYLLRYGVHGGQMRTAVVLSK